MSMFQGFTFLDFSGDFLKLSSFSNHLKWYNYTIFQNLQGQLNQE